MATRPTSDRVREALFSVLTAEGWIGDDEPRALRILDLYAGSGALALEAVSRGATDSVLVEQSRDALAAISENVRALDVATIVRVLGKRVEKALVELEATSERFEVVFLDPPYELVARPAFAEVLSSAARRVAPGGVLVLEHASSDGPPTVAELDLDRSRRYGDTALAFYRPRS